MSGDRRSFLRHLAALPLIGGGVTLIGQPTAVAEPVTTELLYSYMAFTAWEHAAAYYAWERAKHGRVITPGPSPMYWFPEHQAVTSLVMGTPPETRAALVMSAIGVDWRGGPHG
ncbi:hypothetical protein [Beijerinckia sp. L45]|uniref:hypothetical protein n=1 Tax=Beijerinckia sp. L45 TaxID=1641855 RepID=UPI00131E617A|nr:hypothetical protein [Beijerinckia sp. L45]